MGAVLVMEINHLRTFQFSGRLKAEVPKKESHASMGLPKAAQRSSADDKLEEVLSRGFLPSKNL